MGKHEQTNCAVSVRVRLLRSLRIKEKKEKEEPSRPFTEVKFLKIPSAKSRKYASSKLTESAMTTPCRHANLDDLGPAPLFKLR